MTFGEWWDKFTSEIIPHALLGEISRKELMGEVEPMYKAYALEAWIAATEDAVRVVEEQFRLRRSV